MAQWYYGMNGGQLGPVEEDEIRAMLASGMINRSTLIWRDGMPDWLPLGQVPEWDPQRTAITGAPVPGYHYPGTSQPTNGTAIASMVCGILSLVLLFSCGLGVLVGIPAVICGHLALRQLEQAGFPQQGRGMAIAGLATGYVSIGLTLVGVLFLGVAIATGNP